MKLKNERGSVTLIVLVTILFFVIILAAAFSINASLRKSQLKSQLALKEIYEVDLDNAAKYLQITDKYKFSDIYLTTKRYTDSNGEVAYIPKGFAVCISNGGNKISEGLIITDEIDENNYSTGNEWIWVPDVGIDNGALYNYDSSSTVPVYSGRDEEVSNTYYADFQGMKKSVNQYGGYYVGRYELTGTVTEPAVKSGMPVQGTNATYPNYLSWSDSYSACKKLNQDNSGNEINDNVVVGMLYGCQWDNILNWLILTGNKTYSEIAIDSTGWGNSYDAIFTYYNNGSLTTKYSGRGGIIPTGSTEYTKANNIYDLAGNVSEWTMESCAVVRGSDYRPPIVAKSKNTLSASYIYPDEYTGARASFYIKSDDTQYPTIRDLQLAGTIVESNTKAIDDYYNEVTILEGFKVASDSATAAEGGIVITDGTNEFVWIPVGQVRSSIGTKTIKFSRYTFSFTASDATKAITEVGADDIYEDDDLLTTKEKFTETSSVTYAKDIKEFQNSVSTYNGYYIGRYEARKNGSSLTENVNYSVWNPTSISSAVSACKNMYSSSNFTSDLINSYAWDTTVMYIQTFSDNSKYYKQKSNNKSDDVGFLSYGTAGTDYEDKELNIYDLASNCSELTTEKLNSEGPSLRGGNYLEYTSIWKDPLTIRLSTFTAKRTSVYAYDDTVSFRPILYINY